MQIEIAAAEAGRAIARPAVRLDRFQFDAFRAAVSLAGGRYDGQRNVLPADAVPTLVRALRERGLSVRVDASTAKAYERGERERAERIARAEWRLEACRKRGLSPMAFQVSGVARLSGEPSFGLFDDMGLGKSMQALLAMDIDRAVIVCPASLKLNWALKEIPMWRPDLRATILEGRGSFRWPEFGEVIVTNYDILPGKLVTSKGRTRVDGIIPPAGPVALIVDEAHACKSTQARRTRLVKALARAVESEGGTTWALTGTEMLNRPPELWTVLDTFGLATRAFGSFERFMALFGAYRGGFGAIVWGKPSPEIPGKLRAVSLKRMKRDVLPQLPPKRFEEIPVEIDSTTRLLCDEVIAHLSSRGVDWRETVDTVLRTQIAGAGFDLLSKAMTALAAAKTSAALEIVEEYEGSGQPLVVFSAHRAPVDLIGAREGWGLIVGDTPVAERQRIVDEFQAGRLKGVAGTIQAMGVGLTLTRASNVLRVDRDWTPALNRQAEDRVCRIGQEASSITVTDLVGNHELDRRLTRLLLAKADLLAATTEAAAVGEDAPPPTRESDRVLEEIKALAERWAAEPAPERAEVTGSWRTLPSGQRVRFEGPQNSRRAAKSPVESWAESGLVNLAGLDSDRASALNGIGFSKFDSTFGHRLAERIRAGNGLTDREWEAAVRMAQRYRQQLPDAPAEDREQRG